MFFADPMRNVPKGTHLSKKWKTLLNLNFRIHIKRMLYKDGLIGDEYNTPNNKDLTTAFINSCLTEECRGENIFNFSEDKLSNYKNLYRGLEIKIGDRSIYVGSDSPVHLGAEHCACGNYASGQKDSLCNACRQDNNEPLKKKQKLK